MGEKGRLGWFGSRHCRMLIGYAIEAVAGRVMWNYQGQEEGLMLWEGLGICQ